MKHRKISLTEASQDKFSNAPIISELSIFLEVELYNYKDLLSIFLVFCLASAANYSEVVLWSIM